MLKTGIVQNAVFAQMTTWAYSAISTANICIWICI